MNIKDIFLARITGNLSKGRLNIFRKKKTGPIEECQALDENSSAKENTPTREKEGKNFEGVATYCLIIGNSRSGSTILGSVIDAHPNAIIANETNASQNFWRGLNKDSIVNEVYKNACSNHQDGRLSEGYKYQIGGAPTSKGLVKIYGDKIWNPATLILHGDYGLINGLSKTIGNEVKLIAAIRNPFDTIATMHKRSRAPIADRIRWYFMHCEALSAIEEKTPYKNFLFCHHELLVDNPNSEISRIYDALDLSLDEKHIKNTSQFIFKKANKPSKEINWKTKEVKEIVERMERFSFLKMYLDQAPIDC